jgi:hypothetical protein
MDISGARVDLIAAASLLQSAADKLKPDPVPLLDDDFEALPVGRWAAGSVHGAWKAVWGSQGIVQAGTSKVLDLAVAKKTPDVGLSVLTMSVGLFGDLDLTLRMITLSQTWATPRPYHVGWVGWRSDADLSNGYYLILKPSSFEVGRTRDVGAEEQLFFATGPGSFPVGRARTVRVRHVGRAMQFWVDDVRLIIQDQDHDGAVTRESTVTDTRNDALPSGRVALYAEDSRVQFDDVRVVA